MNYAEFFTYFLKAGGLLLLFWSLYKLILAKETFFEHNRWYLILGMLLTICLPLLVITRTEIIEIPLSYASVQAEPEMMNGAEEMQATVSLYELLFYIYLGGVTFFLLKLLMQLASLYRILAKGEKRRLKGMTLVYSEDTSSPFSFFTYIVLPVSGKDREEEAAILAHEFIHARQGHSIDILLMHLLTVFMWINPIAWLYRSDVAQNLEFLADKGASKKSNSPREYQYILLRQHLNTQQLSIINPFINSLIKKRIVMLQQRPSNAIKVWKLSLVLPLLIAFVFLFNVKTVAQFQVAEADHTDIHMATDFAGEAQEHLDFMIHKEMDDDQLKSLKAEVEREGGKLKWKKIKRNDAGLITAISIEYAHNNSTASANYSNDEGIENINFGTRAGKGVYIEAGNNLHSEHEMIWIGKDDAKHVKKEVIVITDGDSVITREGGKEMKFFINKGDGDETVWITKDGENIKVDGEKEMKFIIKNGENENVWISGEEGDKDGEVIIIENMEDDESGEDGKKVKKIRVKVQDANEEVIHIKGDSTGHKKIVMRKLGASKGDNNIHMISTDGKKPLMIVDGKETKEDVLKTMDPDKIDKVEILKGEKAVEKYGEKGKNGVVIITTKK